MPLRRLGRFALLMSGLLAAPAWSQLSSNSGINPNDTFVVFDLTFSPSGNLALNRSIQTENGSISSVASSMPRPHFHVEMGFDTNDQMVANITPSDPPDDPSQPGEANIGVIKIRNNQIQIFDGNGTLIPILSPGGLPVMQKLFSLGVPTAHSLTQMLVTNDPQAIASQTNGSASSPDGFRAHAMVSIPQSGQTQQMQFAMVNSTWVLHQMSMSQNTSLGAISSTFSFDNVAWNSNPAGDSRRASFSPANPTDSNPGSGSAPSFTPPQAVPASSPFGATGVNDLILQHGYGGDHTSWDTMKGWLASDLRLRSITVPDLNSTSPLTSQTAQLSNTLSSLNQPTSIAIGHSQGGLIVRGLAQQYPQFANGVITVDSPNAGSISGLYGSSAAQGIGALLLSSCGSPLDFPSCGLGGLAGFVGAVEAFKLPSSNPNVADITPGSNYLAGLNAQPESFVRVGIVSESNKRWLWARVIGDGLPWCGGPTGACGGRAMYDYIQGVYFFYVARTIVDIFFGFFDPALFFDAADAVINILKLEATNTIWDHATGAVGDASDGLVPAHSQLYPNASVGAYYITNADSHSGNLKSPKVRKALDDLLQQQFAVARAGCVYSMNLNTTNLPFQGGALAVTMNTGQGCAWTAISNDPFVETSAIVQGPMTLMLHVDINLSKAVRTTTIEAQGQSIVITQDPYPNDAAIARIVVDGSDNPYSGPCNFQGGDIELDPNGNQYPNCPANDIWDSGQVSLTVNGTTFNSWYGQYTTAVSLAQDLAAGVSSSGFVVGGSIGNVIYVVSLNATPGTNTDYSVSGAAYSTSQYYFPNASFSVTPDTTTLIGNP